MATILKSNKTRKVNKRTIVTIVGVVGAIAVGALIGFLLAFQLSPKGIDYSGINDSEYEDNIEDIYNGYFKNPKDPLSYTPNDLANISIYKYSLEKYTRSDIRAEAVSLGVKQTTYGTSIKNDTEFFNESVSQSSFVKVAKRFYESGDEVEVYNGTIVNDSGVSATYSDVVEYKLDDYVSTWGKDLADPVIYIISSKTTLDTSKVEETSEGYLISLDLDPLTSVVNYVKQMVQMSNLSDPPQFDYVHLEFSLDKDLNLKQLYVHEAYNVWVFGKNYTESTLTEKYSVLSSPENIPGIDEKIIY